MFSCNKCVGSLKLSALGLRVHTACRWEGPCEVCSARGDCGEVSCQINAYWTDDVDDRVQGIMATKPRPSIEQMRLELTRYEIEEVFYTKDYQAMLMDNRPTQQPLDSTDGWRSEADIEAYFKASSPEEIEETWEDTCNAFGEYKGAGDV
jgi:hypothetical protein